MRSKIISTHFGAFDLQYSFGLQQSNMSLISKYLGADAAAPPLLPLARPMTGLILRPIIGAMSERTITRWGRRLLCFIVGAISRGTCAVIKIFGTCLNWVHSRYVIPRR